ncbi:fungal-specific transcription factor domain-containing protein [Biscogniauxia marginata]|nr:fungal-specific transcription factor domain-containing protein [Biscogniauxia marginata]
MSEPSEEMDPPVTNTTTTAAVPTMLSPSSPRALQQSQSKPLSCTSCRARKLKCDRQHPCRNCVRSGYAECVFPERKRSRRPRKSKNSELLQRLHRLESIVGKVGLENFGDDGTQSRQPGASTSAAQSYAAASDLLNDLARSAEREAAATPRNSYPPAKEGGSSASPGLSGEAQRQGGQQQTRPQDSTASRYLSGDFWASLCEEVGGLRQALEQSADSDAADEDDGSLEEGTTPESTETAKSPSSVSPAAVLLGPSPATALSAAHVPLCHPPPEHIRFLTATYFQNVDMLLKILHRPTVTAALHAFADSLERDGRIGTQPQQPQQQHLLNPEREALFFAIYYAAVTSLPAEKCAAHLGGQSRQELAQTYQAGIERALARADYLNSSSLETLQALTLYTCCLRSHDGSRASWALLSLPIRLAQALDLHRDGVGDDNDDDDDDEHGGSRGRGRLFTPFEAEQRRRLWWQLIVLDIRAAEDRGTRAIVARDSYDTRLPHNVDDADFGPATAEPLSRVERRRRAERKQEGGAPSDVTFSLCTAESSGIFLYFEHAQNNVDNRRAPPPPSSSSSSAVVVGDRDRDRDSSISEEETVRLARHLEARFVHGADPTHAASYLASVTVRLIILKLWLAMRYPLHRPPRASPSPSCSSSSAPNPTPPHPHLPPPPPPPTAAAAAANTQARPPPPPPRRQQPAPPRESTLRTAVTIMELSERGRSGPFGENFRWWSDTYVQWHPLAVALAELCALHRHQHQKHQQQSQLATEPDHQQQQQQQQQQQLIDKAWSVIDAVFPKWSRVIADAKRGTLWRPIRALYKKAREARDAAAAARMAEGRGQSHHAEGLRQQQQQQQQQQEVGHIKTEQEQQVSSGLGDLDMDMDMDMGMEIGRGMNVVDSTIADSMAGSGGGGGDGGSSYESIVPPDLGDLSLNLPTNGMSQEWLAWPDISFDMPPSDSTGWDTGMDWSTWDQFVLDTYADHQSKSGSSEPS